MCHLARSEQLGKVGRAMLWKRGGEGGARLFLID